LIFFLPRLSKAKKKELFSRVVFLREILKFGAIRRFGEFLAKASLCFFWRRPDYLWGYFSHTLVYAVAV